MMKIRRSYIDQVRRATSAGDLHHLVQNAIELEHATIPPYLCGYFTLKPGGNARVGKIIRSVVIEEMLHMTLASNLLIALGGKPRINSPDFVPDYPGGLPMGIGDALQVHLRACSIDQVRDVFMAIEEPEEPIDIPVAAKLLAEAPAGAEEAETFETIGAFYAFLADKIRTLGDSIFTGTAEGQVIATKWFPDPNEMFPITDVESACKAINVIVDQGEGTHTDPFDAQGNPAHFYRFQEIVKGRELVPKPGAKPPYVYGGKPVAFAPADVWAMDDDPKAANYRPGSLSRRRADQFNYSYTMLLNALHRAFNGEPEQLDAAMGVMYELRVLSQQTLSTPAEWTDASRTETRQTGLSFEYQPVNG